MGRLVDDILHIHDLALAVPEPVADYVPGPLQLLQGGADAVRALLADFGQAPGGVVPVLRQGQHHGEQPFGFQRQPRIPQVVVGHHRVVSGFFNAKYRHVITSFRRSGKVLVFGEKMASMSPGHLGWGNLWAVAFRLIGEEKTWDFRLISVHFCRASMLLMMIIIIENVTISANTHEKSHSDTTVA